MGVASLVSPHTRECKSDPGNNKKSGARSTTDMFADCDEPQASVSDVEERRVAERDEGRSRRSRTRDDVDPENVRDRTPVRRSGCSSVLALGKALHDRVEGGADLRSGRKRREMRTSPLRLRMKNAEIMFGDWAASSFFPASYFQTLLLPSCTVIVQRPAKCWRDGGCLLPPKIEFA